MLFCFFSYSSHFPLGNNEEDHFVKDGSRMMDLTNPPAHGYWVSLGRARQCARLVCNSSPQEEGRAGGARIEETQDPRPGQDPRVQQAGTRELWTHDFRRALNFSSAEQRQNKRLLEAGS